MGYNGYGQPLTAPLSNYDVCKALGKNTLDVGTLCTSNEINQKSFHKPMEVDTPTELTLENKYAIDGGYNNLQSLICSTLDNAAGKYIQNKAEWVYSKPETWYRLTDFVSYYHQAKDFSPEGEVKYPDNNYQEGLITVTWDADIQKHLPFMASSKNFPYLGLLIYGLDSANYCHIGNISDYNDATTTSFRISSVSKYAGKYDISIIPIISTKEGKGDGITTPNDDFNGSVLVLGSTPLKLQYKTLLYRAFENLQITFQWETGGYSNGYGVYNGEFTIWNKNNWAIYVKVRLLGNGYLEESGNSDSWVVLHETKDYKYIEASGVYSMLNNGGLSIDRWELPEGIDYANVMLAVTVGTYIGTAFYEDSFSHSWSQYKDQSTLPFTETIKLV